MSIRQVIRLFAASSVFFLLATTLPATTLFSSNPQADGWLYGGESRVVGAGGAYVGGAPGGFFDGQANYSVYSDVGSVAAGFLTTCGATCAAWQVGDTIIGLGAVFPVGLGGGVQNDAGAALLSWGVSAATYSLSTNFLGNGRRDFLGGDGGIGSIYATLNLPSISGVYAPTTALQYTGLSPATFDLLVPPLASYIAINASVNPLNSPTSGNFTYFEAYLNVTRLNLVNPAGVGMFTYTGNSLIGIQDYAPTGMASLQTNALINAVPEPATGLLAAGVLLAGWLARRRVIPSRSPSASPSSTCGWRAPCPADSYNESRA